MKKKRLLVALFTLFLMGSCVTTKFTDFPGFMYHLGFDFREYADKGFFFSPDPYKGEHTVRGMMTFHLHPRVTYRKVRYPKSDGYTVKYFTTDYSGSMTQVVEHLNIEELVKYIYELSIDWGGDAFTHFHYQTLTRRTDASEYSEYPYAVITGVVIKRH